MPTPPAAGVRARGPALDRPARIAAVHRELRDALLEFSGGAAGALTLERPLGRLATRLNELLGSRKFEIWLHDRRARQVALAASSDDGWSRAAVDIGKDVPATRALRVPGPRLEADGRSRRLLVPLRGWRRALGALVVGGVQSNLSDDTWLEFAGEICRHVAGAIENLQLIQEVLHQHQLLENTFNSLADLVIVCDGRGHVVQTNEAMAARLGKPRRSLVGAPLDEIAGSDIAGWARGASLDAQDAPRTGQFSQGPLQGVFATTVTPLRAPGGTLAGQVLVLRDITAETELRARLAQNEKLAALGQFVAGVAHEMNNPLQGVLGHLELLMQAPATDRKTRTALSHIYQEGDRAAKIVRNLLVFAGTRRMARRRVSIERVLRRALSSRAAALRQSKIAVRCSAPREGATVTGDALLLQQAFLNLLINAEHAILEAPTALATARRIDITIRQLKEGTVRTVVRDSGGGIPADVLPRIFDPFFTTKDVGQGTGLGLAITYGIIQEHGGHIQAANAPGGGAIFTIDLAPAARQGKPAADR